MILQPILTGLGRSVVACSTDEGWLALGGTCSGVGMLEAAVETAFGVRGVSARSVYHCEWEASTASVLRRIKDASGCEVLIHGNMFTADCGGLRGKLDGWIAGLPCPAFSCAGKQLGFSDPRAWGEDFDPFDASTWGPQPHWLRMVEQIRPGFIVLENVPAYLTGGHYAPLGELLHGMGYEYQDAILGTAESVGGSHKRERVFILAVHRDYDFRARLEECGVEFPDRSSGGHGELRGSSRGAGQSECCDEEVADVGGSGRKGDERGESLCGKGPAAPRSASECGEELGYCEHKDGRAGAGREQGESAGDGLDRSSDAGAQLEHGDPNGRGASGRSGGSGADGAGRELGDAPGGEECRVPGSTSDGDRMPARGSIGGFPLHAPGIDDWMAWASVGTVDPSRMPSIESGVPVVATGAAPSNVDLLRIGGNCVDALEATACIGCLLDRWVGGLGTEGGAV